MTNSKTPDSDVSETVCQVSYWRNISSAPVDSTVVLVCDEIRLTKAGHEIGRQVYTAKCHKAFANWYGKNGVVFPSHWMPLPLAFPKLGNNPLNPAVNKIKAEMASTGSRGHKVSYELAYLDGLKFALAALEGE